MADMKNLISLTPGFSPVTADGERKNRFNGFHRAKKPLKRPAHFLRLGTGLKPGVNEKHFPQTHFSDLNRIAFCL